MYDIVWKFCVHLLLQETLSAHGISIISEMAAGLEEEFDKYYNELVIIGIHKS